MDLSKAAIEDVYVRSSSPQDAGLDGLPLTVTGYRITRASSRTIFFPGKSGARSPLSALVDLIIQV